MRRPKADPHGFTLLEVLVALTIAAFTLTLLYATVSSSIEGVRIAGRYAEGLSRARSHMAALGVNTQQLVGRHEGDDGEGFHWRIEVEPVPGESDPNGDTVYACDVVVSWLDGSQPRHVALESRRLARSERAH